MIQIPQSAEYGKTRQDLACAKPFLGACTTCNMTESPELKCGWCVYDKDAVVTVVAVCRLLAEQYIFQKCINIGRTPVYVTNLPL